MIDILLCIYSILIYLFISSLILEPLLMGTSSILVRIKLRDNELYRNL